MVSSSSFAASREAERRGRLPSPGGRTRQMARQRSPTKQGALDPSIEARFQQAFMTTQGGFEDSHKYAEFVADLVGERLDRRSRPRDGLAPMDQRRGRRVLLRGTRRRGMGSRRRGRDERARGLAVWPAGAHVRLYRLGLENPVPDRFRPANDRRGRSPRGPGLASASPMRP